MHNTDNQNIVVDQEVARTELIKMISKREGSTNVRIRYIKSRKADKITINNEPSALLIKIIQNIFDWKMTLKEYYRYPDWLKEEMKAEAMYDFLRYGHNYNPDRSVLNYIANNADQSFRHVIMAYYKHENISNAFASLEDDQIANINEEYYANLIADRD